ncbi:BED zinc finger family protein [Brugia malayi]|uniref:BED zinc finger family protein n=1 Tax=Brugia malayi TaxID=6279 RepID=A0A0J9XN49_BRUMA|nr:BED zinc finger family protein [Brugia malayi]CDP91758.2 Bm8673, isoform a [Brugia malayi]VIO90329.1 BED zinc finger family protein [Brugia malayi]
MGRRQGNVFDRKEIMDLMQQRLDGSIKSLRELKDRIAEETGEQIALTTLWQQIHKMRGELVENKSGYARMTTSRVSRIDGSRVSIQRGNDSVGRRAPSIGVELPDATGSSLRRSTRASKRKSYSPAPMSSRLDPKKSRTGTTPVSSSNITLVSHSLRCLGMPKKEKVVRRKRIDEPQIWDKNVEESIRQEALRHEEETADDPLAKAKSKVWLFCEKFDEDGESKAKCRICGMVMVRKLGSTRAMLRHLRKMHDNLIEGIIRPVTKRITAIAGKPRGDDGFDIDDDSAWVEEVDEEDFDDYDDEGGPSYAGEVFIREDGSYADGDEFVDVVYVQDGTSFEEIISKSNDGSAFVNNELPAMENRNEEAAVPSRLKRSISDSELARPSSRNGNNDLEHYEDTNLETDRSIGNLNLLSGGEKRRQDIDDEHFSRTITSSILTFPPEQRELVRCAVMQCIEELRSVESTTAEEAEVHEVTDEELVQISDV